MSRWATVGPVLLAQLKKFRHTDECLRYAALTEKAHCIAACADQHRKLLQWAEDQLTADKSGRRQDKRKDSDDPQTDR